VSRTKIPPFIVTLGMLPVADSMSWILAAGQPITVPEYNDAISPLFESFLLGENVFPIIVLVLGFVATSLSSIGTNGDVTSTLSATTNRPRESPACR
jgi:ribose/xylose/arabinose/galactoside ABC-type transport system permease subunit